jgi:hypothetical protein
MATAGLFSCGQGSKSTPDTVDTNALDSAKKYPKSKAINQP